MAAVGSSLLEGREVAKKEYIVKYTNEELEQLVKLEGTGSDWDKAARMTEAEIEAQIASDSDEADMIVDWENVTVEMPQTKAVLNMRIDRDVLEWFRRKPGYQTRINAILRTYMKARKNNPAA